MEQLSQLFAACFTAVNLPYTLLLIAMLLYWLSVIAGALDISILDLDIDLDANVDLDADVDLGADVDLDGDDAPDCLACDVAGFWVSTRDLDDAAGALDELHDLTRGLSCDYGTATT